jgi:hypothetical protein
MITGFETDGCVLGLLRKRFQLLKSFISIERL